MSTAALLARLVDEVVSASSGTTIALDGQHKMPHAPGDGARSDRITLRLRRGDRELAAARANARGMKTCSYLALLIHNHVGCSVALPPKELDQLRVVCAQLGSLGRQLRVVGTPNHAAFPAARELRDLLAEIREEVEAARELASSVVRLNLISWTSGSGADHV